MDEPRVNGLKLAGLGALAILFCPFAPGQPATAELAVEELPVVEDGVCRVCLPAADAASWFRLKWESASAPTE